MPASHTTENFLERQYTLYGKGGHIRTQVPRLAGQNRLRLLYADDEHGFEIEIHVWYPQFADHEPATHSAEALTAEPAILVRKLSPR